MGVSLRAYAKHRGVSDTAVRKAVTIMQQHLEDDIELEQVARDVGVTLRQLQRLFDSHLSTSPKRCLTQLRLDRARHLLMQTEMSVAEVSMASGFSSLSHFCTVYLKNFGRRPTQERGIPA